MRFREFTIGILFGILFGLCVNAVPVWGQESRAIITGTVTDPQKAVIPAATVEVKNLQTNVVTSVVANARGQYTTPPINPGQYSVTVSAPGFKMMVRSNIELRVADRLVLDIQLELGGTTETVMVTAEVPLLETSTGSLSTTINRELVAALPTYARDVAELVRNMAGVQGTPRGTWGMRPFDNMDNLGLIIQGGTAGSNRVLLDGSPHNYREIGNANDTITPPPDAVSEMKVQTNVYDAELGRTGGGVISVSLKSGSNDYHGSVGWYVRNDILNANTFESNAGGKEKTTFRMNQPTAMLSGPIRIPKLYDGRDRTFFMYAVDIYRNSRPQPSSMVVPTDLQRQGDFSQTYVSGTSGPTVTIYDPLSTKLNPDGSYTRTPFLNNKIPADRIDPVAAKIVSLMLNPNLGVVARGQPNLLVTPNMDHEPFNSHVFRFDHEFSNTHKLFITVTRNNRHQINGTGLGLSAYQAAGTPYVSTTYKNWRTTASVALNLTSMISPTLVSTARIGWNQHEFAIDLYGFGFDPTQLGFPPSLAAQAQSLSFPYITIGGFSALGPNYGGIGNRNNYSNNYSVGETLAKTAGVHLLKFGAEASLMLNNQQNRMPSLTTSTTAGFTQANPLVTSATSGDGLASFLLGYPSSLSTSYLNFAAEGQRYYALFFQDDWRVTRKLTLNLGVRWEYESPITDRFDALVRGFDPTTVTNVGSSSGPQIKGGLLFVDSDHRLPYKRDLNNIAPRIGVAYQMASKLVFRGGWAVIYDPTAIVAPSTGFSINTAPSTSIAGADLVPITRPGCTGNNCGMLTNPFPDGILKPLGSALGLQTNVGQSISYVWPDSTVPYSYTFSAGFQYQLPFRSVLEIAYNGRRGRSRPTSTSLDTVTYDQYMANGSSLTSTQVTNPYAGLLPGSSLNGAKMTLQQSLLPYPQFTAITETNRTIGTSRYDALQVTLEKRLTAGLTVLFSGTYAKASTYTTYLNPGMDAIGQFIKRDGGIEPYIFNLNGSYNLPFFNKASGLVNAVLGGWQIAGFGQWHAGTIMTIADAYSTGIDAGIDNPTYAHRLNTCTFNMNTNKRQNCASTSEPVAWIIQKPFTLNTQPQLQWSSVRSRIPLNVDLSLYKSFRISTERVKLDLRADANNAFNTPRFGNPTLSATSSLFGVTTLTQANMPRSIQISLKLRF